MSMLKNLFTLVLVLLMAVSSVSAEDHTPLDKANVNAFDRNFIYPYNKTLDKSATIFGAGLCLAPALVVAGGNSDILTMGVMYAETLATTIIAKEVLKNAITKARPYMYTDTVEEGDPDGWYDSMPSAHTAVTFAAASFTTYTFAKYYPESPWKWPLAAACYGVAALEGAFRVRSGNHFPSDVLAGAALGTAIGFGVPMLHTLGKNVEVGVTPFALAFNLHF